MDCRGKTRPDCKCRDPVSRWFVTLLLPGVTIIEGRETPRRDRVEIPIHIRGCAENVLAYAVQIGQRHKGKLCERSDRFLFGWRAHSHRDGGVISRKVGNVLVREIGGSQRHHFVPARTAAEILQCLDNIGLVLAGRVRRRR